MTHAAASRDDLSRFVVHLTRQYEGTCASANLLSILDKKVIEARNAHCLFKHKLGGFTATLAGRFKTACFTETPLTQIRRLVAPVKRRVKLKPFGVVFLKDTLIDRGGSPAIYLNTHSTRLREYLLDQFEKGFVGVRSLKRLQKKERELHEAVIQYYSLVNIISGNHDFMWEREWRFLGDFRFKYVDVMAILAPDPEEFRSRCRRRLSTQKYKYVTRIQIISPEWNYEDIVEELSQQSWSNARAERVARA